MSSNGVTPALSAQHLSCRFGQRTVVDDVSLEVWPGTIVGLLGANGAGKTTSFHAIAGLLRLRRGCIALGGRDITSLPLYRRVRLGLGYLPQEPTVFRRLTAEQNLLVVLERQHTCRHVRRQLAQQALERAALSHVAHVRGEALSGGERRRLELARALVCQPTILLLDEPFAGVDPIAVGELQQTLRGIAAQGIGVLITDHNVIETLRLCDRAYLLHAGRVLKEGTPDAIVADTRVRQVYLGESFAL